MFKLNTVTAADIKNKTVLMRVDFNVPLKEVRGNWQVADDRRLQRVVPTLQFLLENNAKVVVMSHLGRPKTPQDTRYSLKPIADHIREKLNLPITFVPATIGQEVRDAVVQQQPASILLLENLRFHKEEKENDPDFARQLASVADVYINEAFSASHRQHASVVGVTEYLPSFAGLALTEEVTALHTLMEQPKRPFVVVLGGAKNSDKVGALKNLSKLADIVLIGGAAANNFLKAEGFEIYRSFVEEKVGAGAAEKDYSKVARKIIKEQKTEKILKDGYIPLPKILYPVDVVAAPSLETHAHSRIKTLDLHTHMADQDESVQLFYLDIGPKTRRLYTEIIAKAGTVFWNGPMGVWENPAFAEGTKSIAQAIVKTSARTVIGGGDTIAAAHHFHLEHKFSYVSAAGGAALELLSGEMLPGIKPILGKG
jgi:3-phosphoglycerate kinase